MSRRDRALEELTKRVARSGERELGSQDYLARYEGDSGEIDSEGVSKHGLNRVLFALDVMGGEREKPAFVHLLVGVLEIFIGERFGDGGD
jgi:hypothetical protein